MVLILKIKELGDGDLENKGLTKIDPENKGFKTFGEIGRPFWGIQCRRSLVVASTMGFRFDLLCFRNCLFRWGEMRA